MGNKTSQTVNDPGAGGPAGWWRLTQSSGATVPDASGTGNTATASSGVTWTGSGARLPGQDGQDITTRGPVVDTTGSFSGQRVGEHGRVHRQQPGGGVPGRELSRRVLPRVSTTAAGTGVQPARQDENDPPASASATPAGSAQTGTWTFLTGVLQREHRRRPAVRQRQPTAAATPLTRRLSPPAGRWRSDAEKWDGQAGVAGFDGTVANVEVYPTALSAAEVAQPVQAGPQRRRHRPGQAGHQLAGGPARPGHRADQPGRDHHQLRLRRGRPQAVVTGPPVASQAAGGHPGDRAARHHDRLRHVRRGGRVAGPGRQHHDLHLRRRRAAGLADPADLHPARRVQPGQRRVHHDVQRARPGDRRSDPDGNTTQYSYDQLGDRTGQTDPGRRRHHHRLRRRRRAAVGHRARPARRPRPPTTTWAGQLTATSVERYPSAASYTTTTSYAATTSNPSGTWKSSVTSPDGVATSYGYDAAGETTQVTDGAGDTTRSSYRRPRAADRHRQPRRHLQHHQLRPGREPDRPVQPGRHRADAAPPRPRRYNGEGEQLSTTDALGNTSAYTYDAAGNLTAETQPVTSASGIVTSFGYDAAGNQTRYTDGNGSNWITTYNSWGLPETQVEPAAGQYTPPATPRPPSPTTATGSRSTETEPGGVALSVHLQQHERPDRPVRVGRDGRDRDPVVHLRRRREHAHGRDLEHGGQRAAVQRDQRDVHL